MVNQLRYVKLLPLQGDRFANIKNPGRCPGLRASAPSGRAAYLGFLASGRAAYIGFLAFRACGAYMRNLSKLLIAYSGITST